jgi:hypothetical protein
MRHVVIAATILLAAVVVGFGVSPARTSGQTATDEIAQPSDWVPFDADVQISFPSKASSIDGRFFRGSDGSSRLETWDRKDPSTKVISIKNIARVRQYVSSPANGWKANPMLLPPNGWHPARYRASMKNLVPRRDQLEGLQLYQLTGPEGDVEVLAPALNFFPVVRQYIKDGERWGYSNIRVREQDPALFEPPPGAAVTERTEPLGIVVGKTGADLPRGPKGGPACPVTPSKPK